MTKAGGASYAVDQHADQWRWRVLGPHGILLAQGLVASECQASASALLFAGAWDALKRKTGRW